MKFEDFVNTLSGSDIFEKAKKVTEVINTKKYTGNESLGIQLLGAPDSNSYIKEKNGFKHSVIMLGSNSYLNLTTHPQVVEGARKALEKYGYGMGAVSVYAGICDLHKELEYRIAKFYSCEDAILFPSGYGTNIGVISALCGENDVIINDSANHASIFDGCKLSGAQIKVYPHNDIKYLEKILSKIDDSLSGRLIITDGVFSMYGDIAKLDKIVHLASEYNAKVMVDDAHGLGIIGPTGKGTAQHWGLEGKVDLNVGMLSKTPGAVGGYCTANKETINYLRLYARSYFFSTALPAPVVGGLIEVFKLLEQDKAGRKELWEKISYLKNKLKNAGFNLGKSESGIVPIIIGNEETLFKMNNELRLAGVYANVVTYPAVRRKECRIRICVMKNLDYEQLDRAVEIITEKGLKYGVISLK